MKPNITARREFLLRTGGVAAVAWVNAQWPSIVAAAQHAHEAAKNAGVARLEVLTPEQGRNVEALASQIVPSDEMPGAREAGVVYFIDRALKTFAKDTISVYQKGLQDVNRLMAEKHPGVTSFADGTPAQQESVWTILAEDLNSPNVPRRRRNAAPGAADFVHTIWQHTIFGFLADPEAGGNRDYAGWKVIDRDPAHSFSPPFGFYDKDYPGWEAAALETEKK